MRHIRANVVGVESHPGGDIAALTLDGGRRVAGDLFVDCTGAKALLVGEQLRTRLDLRGGCAVQRPAPLSRKVPYADPERGSDRARNASHGPGRRLGSGTLVCRPARGLGYVYAQRLHDAETAQRTLARHIGGIATTMSPSIDYRTIPFTPGYRRTCWVRNCVAVGLSAGFVEPLEASALALVEQAATFIAEQLPRNREIMEVVAKRFNARMHYTATHRRVLEAALRR